MKKIKRIGIGMLASACISCTALPGAVYSVSGSVQVTLPAFPVSVNGTVVDNSHREYPLLVYKGITYFPLTYADTRYLGLETGWDSAAKALSVDKSDISGAYQEYWSKLANKNAYEASICSLEVKVNNKVIDSSKEAYPLLTFRDVTYFPMTWKFGVEEFGWDYSFDQTKGLVISSGNAVVKKLAALEKRKLHDSFAEEYDGDYGYNVRLIGGLIYYEGQDGTIYQMSVQQPGQSKKIFQLPRGEIGGYVNSSMEEMDGKLVLRFRVGGGFMGHNEIWQFEKDGTAEQLEEDMDIRTAWGDGFSVSTSSGMFSERGNLFLTLDGRQEERIGSKDVYYEGTPVVSGTKVYVVGCEFSKRFNSDAYGLYEVDTVTKVSRRLTDDGLLVDAHCQDRLGERGDGMVYFVAGDIEVNTGLWTERNLYALDPAQAAAEGNGIKLVTKLNFEAPQYTFCGGKLYYSAGSAGRRILYRLGESEPLSPGDLTYLYESGGYVIAGFRETQDGNARLLVFDADGKTVYRSSDVAHRPQVDQDRLLYVTKDGDCCMAELKTM